MKIKLLYFAQLKDVAGVDEQTLEICGPVTVKDFAREFLSQPLFQRVKDLKFLYAVNGEFTEPDHLLEDQSTLAILPPVAGG